MRDDYEQRLQWAEHRKMILDFAIPIRELDLPLHGTRIPGLALTVVPRFTNNLTLSRTTPRSSSFVRC
jgi:hypothetical protein